MAQELLVVHCSSMHFFRKHHTNKVVECNDGIQIVAKCHNHTVGTSNSAYDLTAVVDSGWTGNQRFQMCLAGRDVVMSYNIKNNV